MDLGSRDIGLDGGNIRWSEFRTGGREDSPGGSEDSPGISMSLPVFFYNSISYECTRGRDISDKKINC